MLMRHDDVMTNGAPQVQKQLVALSMLAFLCDAFLVPHVSELTHPRPLHTQMFQIEKY